MKPVSPLTLPQRQIRVPKRHTAPPASGISMTPIVNTIPVFLPGLSNGLPTIIPLQTDPPPGPMDLSTKSDPPNLSILQYMRSPPQTVPAARTTIPTEHVIRDQVREVLQHPPQISMLPVNDPGDEKLPLPSSGIWTQNPQLIPDPLRGRGGQSPRDAPPNVSRTTTESNTPERNTPTNSTPSSPFGNSRPPTPLMPSEDPDIINAQCQELGDALLTLRHHEVSEKLTPLCKDWRVTKESLYGYDERSRLWIVRQENDLGLWINELIKRMVLRTRTSIGIQRQRQIANSTNLPQEEKDRQEKAYIKELKRLDMIDDKNGNQAWTNSVTAVTIPRLRRLSEFEDFENKLDAEIDMLALKDGTILDLQTLVVRPRVKSDYCTMVAGVNYDPAEEYKEWEDLVDKFQCYDRSAIEYFQECVAYSLTGSTHLQIYMFVIGKPNGGKTSVFDVLLRLAGDYGYDVPKDVYLKEKGSHNKEAPSPNMMQTMHKRFGVTAELAPDEEFSSQKLNTISSGERYTGRGLYTRKPKTFPLTMKAWFHSNYRPKMRLDLATIKRFRYFKAIGQFMDNPDEAKKTTEFQKIAGYEHQFRDPKKLSGVLNWILKGLARFNARGRVLPPVPASMVEALQDEVSDQDYVGQWREACIDIAEEYKDSDYTLISDLYSSYCNWFSANHRNISNPIKSSNKLGSELKSRYKDRWVHKERGNAYLGFKIQRSHESYFI
jgi:phage/plasmid-associated DNA primase